MQNSLISREAKPKEDDFRLEEILHFFPAQRFFSDSTFWGLLSRHLRFVLSQFCTRQHLVSRHRYPFHRPMLKKGDQLQPDSNIVFDLTSLPEP